MVSSPRRLSDADRERLARIIGDGETRTAAELVVVIAESCGRYGFFAFLWPAIAALLVGGVVALVFPAVAAQRLFLLQAVLFVVLGGILYWDRLLLSVVPGSVRRAHAQHAAEHQFAMRVQGRTPTHTGVLLFVALAERVVFILPDTGISAAIELSAWGGIIDRLVAATRGGPAADALAAAIEEIFAVLASHFPRSNKTEGALPNEVIRMPSPSSGSLAE